MIKVQVTGCIGSARVMWPSAVGWTILHWQNIISPCGVSCCNKLGASSVFKKPSPNSHLTSSV